MAGVNEPRCYFGSLCSFLVRKSEFKIASNWFCNHAMQCQRYGNEIKCVIYPGTREENDDNANRATGSPAYEDLHSVTNREQKAVYTNLTPFRSESEIGVRLSD